MKMNILIAFCILFIVPFSNAQTQATSVPVRQKEDTVKALSLLFQRKHSGGVARSIVFGVLGVSALAGTANYKPSTVNYNGQVIQTGSDSPPPINYIFIGFFAVMTGTGISNASKFSKENLVKIQKDYAEGKPLPQWVKSRLRDRDFKW
jgi:hypothetical protein